MFDIIFIVIGVLLFLYFTRICLKHKKPVKTAFLNMLSGVLILAVSSMVLGMFGISLMVNLYTVPVSLALGIPGVALIIVKLLL